MGDRRTFLYSSKKCRAMSKLNSKQMKQTETKIGVLIHMDTLRNCTKMLPTAEQRAGLLETLLHAYYPKEFKLSTDHWTLSAWTFLEDNIKRNDAKFDKNAEKAKKNWESWNEKKAKKQAEQNAEMQRLREENNKLLQRFANVANNTSTITSPIEVKSSTTASSTTTTTTSATTTSTSIDNSILENKEDINKNSFSENKYTIEQVREILERERIFFKQNWLREFFHLNSINYKWKYDPISAAHAYIKIHPDSVRGEKKENTPPTPAAPPAMTEAIAAAYAADGYRAACELWDAVYKEIRPKISNDDAAQIANYLRPDIAWRNGYRSKVLRFKLDDTEVAFAELFKRIDPVIARFSAVFDKYGVKKIMYASTKPVTPK